MIVAGEASGDSHAARLVDALREQHPATELHFYGCAGRKMKAAGVEAIVDAEGMAIIGILEVIRELPMFLKAFRKLKSAALERRPDALILVDFPEFNLRLAKTLSKSVPKVIYYISPQVWAWKQKRVQDIKHNVDQMLSILPFEKAFYSEHGFEKVTYVGHPIAGSVKPRIGRKEFCERHGLDPQRALVTLLPGSRRMEIKYTAPVLAEAGELVRSQIEGLQLVVALAPSRSKDDFESAVFRGGVRKEALEGLVYVNGETHEALGSADAAAVTSGTATLEAAVIGTPMCVVYKVSKLNNAAIRPRIKIDTFGLVNLIAGHKIARELIQNDLTAQSLAEEIRRLLDPQVNERFRAELESVRRSLGKEDASKLAAQAVARELDLASD